MANHQGTTTSKGAVFNQVYMGYNDITTGQLMWYLNWL